MNVSQICVPVAQMFALPTGGNLLCSFSSGPPVFVITDFFLLSVLSFTPEVLELACRYTNALWLALMWDVSPAVLQETSRTRTRHVKNDCRRSRWCLMRDESDKLNEHQYTL